MNKELKEALDALEKEKNISKDTLFEAIENALLTACKNNYGKADNVRVEIDRDTCDYDCYAEKTVVETPEEVEDPMLEIPLAEAQEHDRDAQVGGTVRVDINSQSFGRIATQIAKNVILQKIREEERSAVYKYYFEKQKDIVTGIVQRNIGKNISVNLGRADGLLSEKEQVPGEHLRPTERVKVYILEVRDTPRGPRILVSRTHPELVKRLFEQEVAEIHDGTVEIMSIAREAGSRTKIAVCSNDPNVDPVGACVGMNGARVNNIVDELNGEKIDIVNWDENPGNFIQNALSPAKIVAVFADPEEKTAKVVVPDYQLSLAIGREGQNARLAARLTGYKIDIKSETQAKDAPGFRYEDYLDDEEYEDGDGYEGEYESEEETYESEAADETYESESDAEESTDAADEGADAAYETGETADAAYESEGDAEDSADSEETSGQDELSEEESGEDSEAGQETGDEAKQE
ncbi:MAG: transcription termination factor NusA [Eubacteriales bacterium]|nr:transcription termination factor NusA [Eubacteriales bacterium]